MNILITTGLFYPSKLGGVAIRMCWVAKALVSRGFDISVVSGYNHIDDVRVIPDRWINMEKINAIYCTSKLKIIWKSIREIRNTDVVILASFCYKPNFFVAIYALLMKKMILWSPAGELFSPAINERKLKIIYFKIIRFLFSRTVIFQTTSFEEKQLAYHYLGDNAKVVTIPNYMYLPVKEDRKIDKKYLLFVGRIVPIKALDNLIEGLIKSEIFMNSDYKMILAGPFQGEYHKILKSMIMENGLKERVLFIGNIEGKELNQLYANAYFLILVSHSENFGNVVIESLAQGTPVIASTGTPWQCLPDNDAGFRIENSPETIACTINSILTMSKKKYFEMRENAYKLCVRKFDIKLNIDKWIKVLTSKDHV
jgi:glycosyltransferase involved in cell wall biosynthesis